MEQAADGPSHVRCFPIVAWNDVVMVEALIHMKVVQHIRDLSFQRTQV